MTDGFILLCGAALVCIAAFLGGLRFRLGWWMPADAPAQFRQFGLLMMLAAPLMLLFFLALCFGLLGPVDGIQTIEL